jgi:hypothetical protein
MEFPDFLLKMFDTIFHGNYMLYDAGIIHFQILVSPCKYILVFLEKMTEGIHFNCRTKSAYVDELWLMRSTQIYHEMHHCGVSFLGFVVVVNLD